tara:strand:- start:2763 stop:4424 length:1662 start_codon:yes stop_codon:yes gene_type:complete
MFEIFHRLKKDPRFLSRLLVASLFVNLLALATPIYVIQVLQRYVAYGVTSTLITLVVGVILISIFEFFFKNIRHRMARELEPINTDIANQVMNKLSRIKTSFYAFNKKFRNDIITSHVQTVQQVFTATNTLILVDLPFTLIFIGATFLIHYQLGIIVVIFVSVPFLTNTLYASKIYEAIKNITSTSMNTARIYENLSSRNISIRYYNLFSPISKTWNLILNQFITLREKAESSKNLLSSSLSLTSSLSTIAIIGWGATLAVKGEISVGALIGANILAARALTPVIKFVQTLEPFKKAEGSLAEIRSILKFPNEKEEGSKIENFSGKVLLKDLYFQYPKTKNPVFEALTCEINSGEIVVVKGSNGSGKTTLIKTIAGILEFSRGQIFYDDLEINQLSLNWIRQNLTYLPQEPEFVDGRLLDNIIGGSEIKEPFFKEILKRTDLEGFVNSHPDGINMSLDDRGENLPVGIRKRIALARSMVVNGKLFLFDEPTAGLDEKGRNCIYNLLNDIKKTNLTLIVATADEKIIEHANIIISLDAKPKPEIIKDKIKYKTK